MSQHLFNDTDITAIANAIRTKKGTQNTMTITQMPAEIESIPSGGSTDPVAVRFIDFDGTVVQELNDNGLNGLIALPEAPDHSQDEIPLTFDEWNWTLADIKTFRTNNPTWTVNVGANYHTTDNKVHFLYDAPDNNTVAIYTSTNVALIIDWGDGSSTDRISLSSVTHTYTSAGRYHGTVSLENPNESNAKIEFTGTQSFLKEVRFSSKITQGNGGNYLISLEAVSYPSNSAYLNIYACNLKWVSIPRGLSNSSWSVGTAPFKYQPLTNTGFSGRYSVNYPYVEDIYLTTGITGGNVTNCCSAKRVIVPEGMYMDAGFFSNCTSLEETNIPSTMTAIQSNTFLNCLKLKHITIPSSVTSIGQTAFSNCKSLTELTIPSSVTSIARQAFASCYIKLIMKGTTPPTLANSNAIVAPSIIMVPYSADHSVLNAYKTASNWSSHADRMFESPAE